MIYQMSGLSMASRIALGGGVAIPLLGLGSHRIGSGREVTDLVAYAIQHGYRLIDTAQYYK